MYKPYSIITIIIDGGIIRHHNAITTEPGFHVQVLEFHNCKAPKPIPREKMTVMEFKMGWLKKGNVSVQSSSSRYRCIGSYS